MIRPLLLLLMLFACDGEDTTPDSGPFDSGPPDSGDPGPVLLSTTTVDLGAVVIGTSDRASFTISNPNGVSLQVELSTPQAPFARWVNIPENAGAFKLEPGGLATVTVTAMIDEEGEHGAELQVDGQLVQLRARGVRSGVDCPETVDLGLANPGSCLLRKIACTNAGNVSERITVIELEPSSDPEMMLDEPFLPIDLAPNGVLNLDVRYCPTALGQHQGAIAVVTFAPFQTERTIQLLGRAGGPDLSCEPSSVDLGAVGVGASVMATVACTNSGFEAAEITLRLDGGAEFSLPMTTLSIGPNESGEIAVAHAPTSAGAKQDTLHILSADPDSPDIAIALTSEALVVDPCSAVLEPSAVDLGLVGVGDARIARFFVRNTGSAACLIREVRLAAGSGSRDDIRLIDPPPTGSTIEPAATRAIYVELAPQTSGTAGATLIVSFSNPGTTELTAAIEATTGLTTLSIDPPVIDFGPSALGCAAPHQKRITMRRIAAGSGRVLTMQILNDPALAFSVAVTPTELSFWETLDAVVSYDPQSAGRHTADLQIFTDSSPTPIVIPVSGEAVAGSLRTEAAILMPRTIDLVFVIDNSISMERAQTALAAAMPAFDQVRLDRDADVRAAVITTDMKDPSQSGRFQGSPIFLEGSSPAFLADLTDRVAPGIDGSGNEMGVLALYSAFTAPLITSENAGFLRPGADLAIVVVSDENDFSPSSPGIPFIVATLRDAAQGELITAGIVGPPTGTCAGPYGTGNAADRWLELIGRVQDNLQTSICGSMDENVRAIAEHVFGGTSIELGGRPVINTIAVDVDGVPLHPALWTYDLSTNRVVIFDPADAPIGASVEITYSSICLSPTCGDGTIDMGEQCDDMNNSAADACVACNDAVCGDALTIAGVEACDDGDLDDGDACLTGCVAASCGDGALHAGVEACDDGNTIGGDGCPATCRFYTASGPAPQAFVPLAGGTPLTFTGGADPNDDGEASIAIPFDFRLFDIPTATLTVSVNGFASTTELGPESWVNASFPATALPDGVMAVWWDDLYLDPQIAGAAVEWAVLGAAPGRTLVIEWRDLRLRDHSADAHRRFTFQLHIGEDGTIRFAYADTETAGVVPSAASASAGLEDPSALRGIEALGCSPACDGRPRPPRADGFPVQSVVTFAP